MSPTGGLLMVLVDAMRWDYVERTTFLRSLAGRSAVGRFEEPFGFTPRTAYFQGVDVEPDGFTHMFEWSPATSPFSAARFLEHSAASSGMDSERFVREALAARSRELVSRFARDYVSPIEIPLDSLRYFDVAERVSPWCSAAPDGSLFRRLTAAGLPWYALAWPDTNGLSDAAVVARAIDEIRPDHRFAFVHLSALDGAGHRFGPGARETQAALEESDGLLEALVDHCRRAWGNPRVIVFGDHGMVPVVRHVDVLTPLKATGLRFGRDIGYFIDSTTVRFWYFTAEARRVARQSLGAADYGRFLGESDRARFGLDRARWQNGEDFFLADPGIVFDPSFFGSEALHGMHGYDPRCADNQGAFIYWSLANEHPRDAGVVRASQLYATGLHGCGLQVPAGTPSPVMIEDCPQRRATYTAIGAPEHEALVSQDMELIRERIRTAVAGCEAIVLGGSFGRGEGRFVDLPVRTAINDYDLLAIGGSPALSLADLRAGLNCDCRTDAVDLAWSEAQQAIGPCQMGYDLRYGGTLLYGAAHVLRCWGTAAPGDLTMDDAWLGVSNRVCGVLTSIYPQVEGATEPRRLTDQFLKLGVAIGDGFLMLWGDYHHMVRARMRRFDTLARAAGVEPDVRDAVVNAYLQKLDGGPGTLDTSATLDSLTRAIVSLAARCLSDVSSVGVTWRARVVAHAVEGRQRQLFLPAQPARPATRLPERFAADLARVYEDAWGLFFARPADDQFGAWDARRRAVTSRWLELTH